MTYSEKLAWLRKRKGLSQGELAKALGTTQQQVSLWEDEGGPARRDYVEKTAEFFGVSLDYLLDATQDEPREELSSEDRLFLVAVRVMGYEKAMAVLVSAIPDDFQTKSNKTADRPLGTSPPSSVSTGGSTRNRNRGRKKSPSDRVTNGDDISKRGDVPDPLG